MEFKKSWKTWISCNLDESKPKIFGDNKLKSFSEDRTKINKKGVEFKQIIKIMRDLKKKV